MTNDANSFLFEGGGKSFQFTKVGDIVRGTIESMEVRQQTSLEDGKPLFWDDGKPRKLLVITLKTAERDGDDDDGMRSIFAKGGRYEIADGEGLSMRDAIAQAVKDAGASSMDPGDELAVGYTGNSKARKGYNPAKLYAASFKKTSKSITAADLFGEGNELAGAPF